MHEEIKRVTAEGIETKDGAHTKLDVIVCATGAFSTCVRFHQETRTLRI